MTTTRPRSIFVNLAVRDLQKSMDFFRALGFSFDPRFTDHDAGCLIVNDHAHVMLLVESYFRTFTRRDICDTSTASEGLFALSCSSRAEVDDVVEKAVAAGGSYAMETQDHGFMYVRSFYDPDGHHWEVMWMDPAALQPPPS
jgi:uncharacterized protein